MDRPAVPILIVDDDPNARFALKTILAPFNFAIIEADSGLAALRCVMVEEFAVIIIDASMREMDGFETAGLIRRGQQSDATPIIFIATRNRDEADHNSFVSQRAVEFVFEPVPAKELQAKVLAFANMFTGAREPAGKSRAVQSAADELSVLNVEFNAVARRDPLTGLRNRRALNEDLVLREAHVALYGHSYCMAVLDVDHFNTYNDTYGQSAGDRVLQAVAGRLTELLRNGDTLYRYGGEEFLCIFPGRSLSAGSDAVERMRIGVQDLALTHAGSPAGVLTLSAGLAVLDAEHKRSAVDVLKEADDALYRAKGLGRNRVEHGALR
jgi:two-component system, cell cycle response regulator